MHLRKKVLSVMLAGAMLGGELLAGIGTLPLNVYAADTSFAGEEWYDQIDVVEENREPAHTYFTPYETAEKALKNEKSVLDTDEEESIYKMSLNGNWKFKFAQKPADREKQAKGEDAKTYVENWDTTDWDEIKVPSSIQALKDEDGNFKYEKPIYSNQRYPWRNYESVTLGEVVTAPTVNNSVGQYKRTFTIPENWDGREVFVSFEGVDSAFYLYVNGKRVGYGEDSYTTDEFNITSYLHEGENTIAAEVYRWCTGSFLENQDFIRLSGIFRDVNLYSKAKVEMRDLFIKTDLDDEYKDATLTLDADIRNLGDADAAGKNYTVTADLYEIDGQTKVWDAPLVINATVPAAKTTVEEKADDKGTTVTGSKAVTNPKKWFADTPNLYMLLIELKDENGQVVETACQRVGFREIAKVDINDAGQEQVQINGEKIMFRGTNRQEIDYEDGRAVSREDITTDLKLMKQFNVNAIRTSHYPNNPYMYSLADELGIYICDETNVESHEGASTNDIPSGYSIWNNSVMDRTQNMVERDKNHPSIVIWSLGNEATYKTYNMNEGYCFYNSSQYILQRDPSRLRKYERDNRSTKNDRANSMVDIYSSQYWGVDYVLYHIKNTANKLPYIQSEYAHSMGNALGNFKEYWDIFRNYDNAQGGFIWDWVDQSILTKLENTVTYTIVDPNTKKSTKFDGTVVEGQNGTKAIKGAYTASGSAALATNSTTGITLDVWLKPAENFTPSQQAFISRGDSAGYNLQIDKDGKFEFFVDGWSQGVMTADIPSDFTNGKWHRLTATYAGTVYKLYYDGKEIGTGTRTALTTCDASGNTIDITIGASADQSGRVFNGAIDRAAVIKGAMTAEQIAATNTSFESVKDNVAYAIDFGAESMTSEGTNYADDSYFGYGGDWGETVTDNDFCANGMLNADRTPSAELYEVKKVHQEVSFYDDGEAANGKVRIVNEFLNTNLNEYNIAWTLKEDNKVIGSGTLTDEQKDIKAQQEKTVTLANFPTVQAKGGADYVLTFSATLKEDAVWAGEFFGHAGDEIAFEEFELSYENASAQPVMDTASMGKVTVNDTDEQITITGKTAKTNGKDFEVVLDKTQGYIESYKVDGKTILTNGPVPNYYRAPISNDPSFSNEMKNAAENFTVNAEGISIDATETAVTIHVPGSIPAVNTPNTIDYVIYGNGQIVVTNTVKPSGAAGNIARIGMKMTVAEGYENYSFYGNGPQANYIDRNAGTKLDVYESTVTEQFESKIIKPQENGNHTGVRWAALTKADGTGIMVSSDSVMEAGALHYKAEDLASYRHVYQVPVQKETILTVDLMQRGLGNASCGPGPLEEYIISAGQTYSQTFCITPLTEKTAAENMTAKSNENLKSTMPLSGIKVDGTELADFLDSQAEYTYEQKKADADAGKVPVVEAVKSSDDVEVKITQATKVPGTAVIEATSSAGVKKIYKINFKVQEALYISDMEWTLDEGGYFVNTRDACGCGAAIAVYDNNEVVSFDKGIGMHATAQLAVNLEGTGVKRFKARIGISADQVLNNPANVNFVVYGDDKELFRKDEVTSNGKSYLIDIDVSNVKVLKLYVDKGTADSNDHAIWADAKLTFESEGTTEPTPAPAEKRQELATAITEGEAIDRDAYTAESVAAYTKVLEEAKKVLVNTKATTEEVNAVLKTLAEAKAKLVKKPESGDTTPAPAEKRQELDTAVKEGETIDRDAYTAESVAAYAKAIEEAKKVLANEKATAEEVNAVLKTLAEAKAKLVKKADNNGGNSGNGNTTPAEKPAAVGTTVTVKGVTYKVTTSDAVNGTVSAVKLASAKKAKITIQNTVKIGSYTFKVTAIEKKAFQKSKKLKSVVIGSNVTSIGANAFAKSSKLANVTFKGTNAVKVGKKAFQGTSAKMKVTVSKKMNAKALKNLKKSLKKAKISKKVSYKKK